MKQQIYYFTYLKADCSPIETPTMRIVDAPAHGRLTFEPGEDYPAFPKENVRSACNSQLRPTVQIFYTSDSGYIGPDLMTAQALFVDGTQATMQFRMAVATGVSGAASLANPATVQPSVANRNAFFYVKAAPTGARQKIDYYYSLNPDCSSAGRTVAHIIDAPANGAISFEEGSDYPNYDKDNQRFECNKQIAPTLRVFYTSKAGFVGSDLARIEIVFPTGNLRTVEYRISVR